MSKIKPFSILALATLLTPVTAQSDVPFEFGDVFTAIFDILGLKGLNFLFTFGLVFVTIYAVANLGGIFERIGNSEQREKVSLMLGAILGLGSAIYVTVSEADIIGVTGPYGIIMALILLGMMTWNFFRGNREAGDNPGSMHNIHIGIILTVAGYVIFKILPLKLGSLTSTSVLKSIFSLGGLAMVVGLGFFIVGVYQQISSGEGFFGRGIGGGNEGEGEGNREEGHNEEEEEETEEEEEEVAEERAEVAEARTTGELEDLAGRAERGEMETAELAEALARLIEEASAEVREGE